MSEIVQNVVSSICELVQYLVCMFLQIMVYGVTNGAFDPKLDTFIGTDADGTHAVLTEATFNIISNTFLVIGLGLVGIFFAVYLYGYIFASVAEIKDSLGQLVLRCIFSIFFVWGISSFLNLFMNYAYDIQAEFIDPIIADNLTLDLSGLGGQGSSIFAAINPSNNVDILGASGIGDALMNFSGLENVLMLFKVIAQIIFFGIVAYNFAKLCMEIVRRYVMMCILFMCSPVAGAFLSSSASQNVFFSYVKMFGTEVGILVFTKLWIHLCLYSMATLDCTFINMFILLTLIQFGIRIEGMLKDLGMTTTNLGGALLDNVAATGAAMALILGRTGNSIGNGMIQLSGLTGSMGLSTLGSALTGKPMSFESQARTMSDSAGAFLRAHATKNNAASNLTNSERKTMDEALQRGGLFRNAELQSILKPLNKAGYQDALNHITGQEYAPLLKNLAKSGSSITPLSYNQNSGIEVMYKSGKNGIVRNGFITDTPKTGNGITSIPIELDNGKMAYCNLNPVSMEDIQNSGVNTYFAEDGQIFGQGDSDIERDTGRTLGHFMVDEDANASHYAARPNEFGGLDILYNKAGIDPVNIDRAGTAGAITKDGYHLKTTSYEWGGSGHQSPEADIYQTLTSGSWSNMEFTDVNPKDIKYDSDTGTIQFSATDKLTGNTSGYTAMPSVSIQNKVTKGNTITDNVHGSYTFSKASHKAKDDVSDELSKKNKPGTPVS